MAARPDPMPPLLPVIPEYTPWLDRARRVASADAAGADAAFAARHGLAGGPPPESGGPAGRAEERRGVLSDEKA